VAVLLVDGAVVVEGVPVVDGDAVAAGGAVVDGLGAGAGGVPAGRDVDGELRVADVPARPARPRWAGVV
jgi:hypothetical protein